MNSYTTSLAQPACRVEEFGVSPLSLCGDPGADLSSFVSTLPMQLTMVLRTCAALVICQSSINVVSVYRVL